MRLKWVKCSVPDPWHVGTDPDLRIHTTDLKIRILLFSSVTFKIPTKNNFFWVFLLVLFKGTFTSFFTVKKSWRKSPNSRNQDFSYYFCLMMEGSGSESRYKPLTNGSGSERPKNLRTLRIRNIGKKQKYLEKIYLFLVSILKANKERPGTASGSVIQWYGSADSDPYQNVIDLEHWFKPVWKMDGARKNGASCCRSTFNWIFMGAIDQERDTLLQMPESGI